MNYKDQLGADIGARSFFNTDHIVSAREGEDMANKTKRENERTRSEKIEKSFDNSLMSGVRQGKITSRQAELLSRGCPIEKIFN